MTIEITTNGGFFYPNKGDLIIENGQDSNTVDIIVTSGLVWHIIVEPDPTDNTLFYISILDSDDLEIWKRVTRRKYNSTYVHLPLSGTYKLKVSRTTTSGTKVYKYLIVQKV